MTHKQLTLLREKIVSCKKHISLKLNNSLSFTAVSFSSEAVKEMQSFPWEYLYLFFNIHLCMNMPGMLMMYTLFCLLETVPFYIAVDVLELTMKTDRLVFNSQRSVLPVPLSAGLKACTTTAQQENGFPEAWSRFGFALFCFSLLIYPGSDMGMRQW